MLGLTETKPVPRGLAEALIAELVECSDSEIGRTISLNRFLVGQNKPIEPVALVIEAMIRDGQVTDKSMLGKGISERSSLASVLGTYDFAEDILYDLDTVVVVLALTPKGLKNYHDVLSDHRRNELIAVQRTMFWVLSFCTLIAMLCAVTQLCLKLTERNEAVSADGSSYSEPRVFCGTCESGNRWWEGFDWP